jgi:hypothetical protein
MPLDSMAEALAIGVLLPAPVVFAPPCALTACAAAAVWNTVQEKNGPAGRPGRAADR